MYSAPKLKKLGVELLDRDARRLRCLVCGEEWECRPNSLRRSIPNRSRLPRGYWKCPHRCNNDHSIQGEDRFLDRTYVGEHVGTLEADQ